MRVGIVGLPNAGKTTLFNALTRAGAEAANYPFTTIDPNVAVVPVRDGRLERVAAVIGASEVTPDTIEFHDIAGLVEGSHRGEGLGNRFLAAIREVHAIVHVVRAHHDEGVVHPEGRVNPVADAQTVESELRHADLEDKPVLYVANVDEGDDAVPPQLAAHARERGAVAVAVSARVEAELAELEEPEAAEMRGELGLADPALERVVRGAFDLLDLVAVFTADPGRPAMSRHLRRGATAHDAAGAVHTDMQRGFVRAEVIPWDELVDAGGFAAARERGTLRVEGRDYAVRDGDVIHIRFTP